MGWFTLKCRVHKVEFSRRWADEYTNDEKWVYYCCLCEKEESEKLAEETRIRWKAKKREQSFCSHDFSQGKHCSKCGMARPTAVCSNCRAEWPTGTKYCVRCGHECSG